MRIYTQILIGAVREKTELPVRFFGTKSFLALSARKCLAEIVAFFWASDMVGPWSFTDRQNSSSNFGTALLENSQLAVAINSRCSEYSDIVSPKSLLS